MTLHIFVQKQSSLNHRLNGHLRHHCDSTVSSQLKTKCWSSIAFASLLTKKTPTPGFVDERIIVLITVIFQDSWKRDISLFRMFFTTNNGPSSIKLSSCSTSLTLLDSWCFFMSHNCISWLTPTAIHFMKNRGVWVDRHLTWVRYYWEIDWQVISWACVRP